MNRVELRIGQKINSWTVLEASGNKWLVRCECDQTFTKLAHDLVRSVECRSCSKRGMKSPTWKGGRHANAEGYILLTNPSDYLGRCHRIGPNTVVALEHVVVMSRHLGRALYEGETVHHKNGIRSDNSIENLELWTKPQPSGIRVDDAVAWAREILRRYD